VEVFNDEFQLLEKTKKQSMRNIKNKKELLLASYIDQRLGKKRTFKQIHHKRSPMFKKLKKLRKGPKDDR